MLRKLRLGEVSQGEAWRSVVEFQNRNGEVIPINEYFARHPEMMLGEMRPTGSMYRHNEPTLEPDGRDLGEALNQAAERLPQQVYRIRTHSAAQPTVDQLIPAPDYVKPNAFCIHFDEVCIRQNLYLRPLRDLPAEKLARIRGLIRVRDAVRECLRSQVDGQSEEQILGARARLNQVYDSFVARFGFISEPANTRAFVEDPDLPLLRSLEQYDPETKQAKKTAIFRERTIQYRQPIQAVATPKEALLATLNQRGRVDLDHMAGLLGRAPDDFLPELKGALYLDPQTNEWQTDDQYLSGNVRAKLADAEAAALVDKR